MSPSLYMHIPFCVLKCIYCDFISVKYSDEKAISYLTALKKELSNIDASFPLSTIFIGGGTPSVLTDNLLTDLINHIFNHLNFVINYEATIEANPGTLDRIKLQLLRSSGINRISIGVQSFNNDELSFLSRIHSSDEAEHAVHLAKEAGFKNIGLDLIYGIPGQSLESWRKTLEKAVSLNPKHVSTYELTVEKGTKLDNLLNVKSTVTSSSIKPSLLNEDLIIEMYEFTIDYLKSNGLDHYEISNFARPGYECRHNLNYWDRGEYFGAGLGAHSFINSKRFHNTDVLDEYIKGAMNNKLAVIGLEEISNDMALSEAIFLGLRKTGGINIESLSKLFNVNILNTYSDAIKVLRKAGLIELSTSDCSCETDLRLTKKGLVLSNEVFEKFI